MAKGIEPSMRSAALRVLTAGILLGLGVRLVLIWSGCCDRCVICDDAYYGFKIARNMVLGLGSTFDGVQPTNGYHPLGVWLSTPFYAAFPHGPWLPIHGVLSLYAVLDVCTALLIWRALARLGMPIGGVFCAVVWMALPGIYLLTLRGCEAAITACLVAALLWLEARAAKGRGYRVASGVLSGLAFLARTDVAILLVLFHPYRLWQRAKAGAGLRRELRAFVCLTLTSGALVVMPWFAWNYVRFGTLFQTSGSVKQQLYGSIGALPRIGSGSQSLGSVLLNPYRVVQRVVAFTVGEEFVPRQTVSHVASVALLVISAIGVAACVWAGRNAPDSKFGRFMAWQAWSSFWALAYVATYGYFMHYHYSWYFAVPLLIWTLWMGAFVEWLHDHFRQRRRTFLCLLAGGLIVVCVGQLYQFFRLVPPTRLDEEDRLMPHYALVNRVAEHDTVVGSWNSGAFGYFAAFHAKGVWVNLDGVVNNKVLDVAKRGEYGEWLLSNVHIIVEKPHWASPFFEKERFREVFSQFKPISVKPFIAVNRALWPDWRSRLDKAIPPR